MNLCPLAFFRRFSLTFCIPIALALPVIGSAQDILDSPDPILITEPNSTRALVADAATWRGGLPSMSTDDIARGSSVILFVTNVDLLPGEGRNAFRVYAEDRSGGRSRLTVEQLKRLEKRPWIYSLRVRVADPAGFNGQIALKSGLTSWVTWRGNASNKARLTSERVVIPDPSGLTPAPAPGVKPSVANRTSTAADRKRFMEQASFGPTDGLDFRLKQIGIRRWIEEQFTQPYPTIPYPDYPQKPFDGNIGCGGTFGSSPEVDRCFRDYYWAYTNQNWFLRETLYGDDQLRRRVSWALHKIWVVSENTLYQQRWMQEYIEVLDRNAFGNYRDVIKEMTLNPGMGEYLDMVRSTRNNPNENYARELLQLFTIGLDLLNTDGSLIIDPAGNRIPTYTQYTINQFSRILTGWTRCDNGLNPNCPNAVVGAPNYVDPLHLAVPGNHDPSFKFLLVYDGVPEYFIQPCNSCTTDEDRTLYARNSLEKAIDNIFYHPNVGPFVSKLLIQHLVTSDPSNAYIERVARAFNNNGAGVRGDMKAVIRAILLDPEARGSRKTDPGYGKLREPLEHLTNILRGFNAGAGRFSDGLPAAAPAECGGKSDGVFAWVTKAAGQEVLYPPSVFSYYSPFAAVPGTNRLGPEFAIAHTGSSVARNNMVYGFTMESGISFDRPTASSPYPWAPCGTSIDLSEAEAWAAADTTGRSLVERLNSKLMHGTMSEAMKQKVLGAIAFDVPPESKARQAIYLIASSSQYQIQR